MNEEGRKARKCVEWEKMLSGRVCVRCGADKHDVSAEVGGGADTGARTVNCAAKGQCDEDTERCSGCVWDADGVEYNITSRLQKVREEEKVETLDPVVRIGFKDGRAALMNESRWLNAEDGDSRGLMLTLVALYIF
ncbi:uncharacterized protein MONOS_11662 [Monocercomonoides exilis]|uniref:uncharacterized protein n=1 Tax=Monocercomonoides exilis TaxID=2049356 RepID=UPI00355A3E34|nr:hypothetical protein MONOS_11662 [Monocercomonoides exilis]|eukprot:MONOS_11662.1-p1 / transcript=MONOS_11662.1 / gene=MONOS_11662 / organism=Monocercomonoides_exilis_PA203 / gene_product=unspecified product / transcript_product=unspecified product / location=Mono_scaffold00598:37834-38426(+) / protein_length=136 / sequence_SO=supercontig / SO=protein_coding / is_pseudo=false